MRLQLNSKNNVMLSVKMQKSKFTKFKMRIAARTISDADKLININYMCEGEVAFPGHDDRCRVGYVQWTTPPSVLRVGQSTLTSHPVRNVRLKGHTGKYVDGHGDRFNSCQVIYSQFGLAIHQNDHQARRRFVEWAQNEIAVVPDFHKRILFIDEAHFWLNSYVNKQNCCIWSEANPQVYVETPLHPEKLTVWCALRAGGILLQKR
ncbi:hypothetical protein TNCV_4401031 [Trichonephila clavipes]|nr:hypothetical protein TNCV_4401031 [Trichonephila clavipes]